MIAESERARETILFDTVRYGETSMNDTFDIYGIDLPKGNCIFLSLLLLRFSHSIASFD